MPLNDMYKEAAKNKIVSKKKYEMSIEDFKSEHKRLLKVLKSGSRKDLDAEYKRQVDEMEEVCGVDMDDNDDDDSQEEDDD